MKRILIPFSMAAVLLLGLSSCKEEKTSVYIIQYEEGSINFGSNLFLQSKVNSEIATNVDNLANTSFTGTESDAISWFNERMDYLESEQFANAEPVVPVLPETSATFSLRTGSDNQNNGSVVNEGGWDHIVTTRTVTFKEPDSLL